MALGVIGLEFLRLQERIDQIDQEEESRYAGDDVVHEEVLVLQAIACLGKQPAE
jgi:hypothetical protein